MKFVKPKHEYLERGVGAKVEDILYENIAMEEPAQWAIWIGPAQQADSGDPCHANPCSLC